MPTTVRSATSKKAIRFTSVAPFADYLFALFELTFIYLLYLAFAAACSINSATSLGCDSMAR
jgi:hypothetical protein